jgi:integrase
MTGWLRAQRAEKSDRPRLARGTFDADAIAYLEKVEALPTYKQRKQHITLWAACFAGRRRRKITSGEIRAQRERWLLEGLAPHTVNLRLRALSNLWTVLDGRRAPNPVRDVPEAVEPDPEPRSIPYWLATRIVEALPARAVLERAQAHVMIATGLTPVELSRLASRHWHADDRLLFVQGRRKGQGGATRLIPLSEDAIAALTQLDAAAGWERLPSKQFYRVFRRACERTADDPLTIDAMLRGRLRVLTAYDLRHTYATALYRISGDAHAAAQMLGHRSKQTTARYIQAALQERMTLAVSSLERERGQKVAT